MSENEKEEKRKLESYDRSLGFLGIIITLVIPIIWDYLKLIQGQSVDALSFYFLCFLVLFLILIFYLLRFFELNDLAIALGGAIFFAAPIVLLVVILPVLPYTLNLASTNPDSFAKIVVLNAFLLILVILWTYLFYDVISKPGKEFKRIRAFIQKRLKN